MPWATYKTWRGVSVVIAVAVLLLTLLLLGACRNAPGTAGDPNDVYRPALKADAQELLDSLPPVPRYWIDVELDPSGTQLRGVAEILVPNMSQDPWSQVVFRLYPVLEQYGGDMTIQNATIDNRPTNFNYIADNTAIQVQLPEPLLPGQETTISLAWRLSIPTWSDLSSIYALFGRSQQMTSLPLFYPALAVYLPGPSVGTGRWWLESGSVRGDAAFNYASLFVVTTTLPSDQVPVTSGTLISTTLVGQNQARHVWVTGPSREFMLHMSPQFTSAYTDAYGTRVTAYWLPGQEAAGRLALRYTVAAMRIYSDRFGPYPFRDMRVAPAPISFRGMEYPQMSLLGVELYGRFRNNLEVLAAHEAAHQWWYQVVHNDPVNSPWLDEALAEYSVKLYMEALKGRDDAGLFQHQRWQVPLNLLRDEKNDAAVDQPVVSYASGNQYETIVYGKGALFYDGMRDILGDWRFFRFLRSYLAENSYGIIDQNDWKAAIEALGEPDLMELYARWIEAPGPQVPLPDEVDVDTEEDESAGDSPAPATPADPAENVLSSQTSP